MRVASAMGVATAAAAFAGAAAVAFSPAGLDPGSVAVVAVGLVAAGLVAAAGFLLGTGRWPWLLAYSLAIFDWAWAGRAGWSPATVIAAASGGAAAAAGAAGRWSPRRRVRPANLTPAPAAAVAALLVPWPVAVGIAAGGAFTARHGVAAVGGWTLLILYSRAAGGSWMLVRVGMVPLGVLAGLGSPIAEAAPVMLLAAAVTVVALAPGAKTAVTQPPLPAAVFRLPPELTPDEVLDQAGLDRSGRRR